MATDLRTISTLLAGAQPQRQDKLAILLAVGVEILLIAGLYWEMGQAQTPPPPALPPLQLQLVQETLPKPTPPAPKPVPKPSPKPVVKPIQKPVPHPSPRPTPRPTPVPVKELTPPSPLPSPVQAPPPPPREPEPPTPAPVNPAVKADYLAQVKGAIQAAVHFPEAARMLGQGGRVLVAFTLANGRITDPRILRKDNLDYFNPAALAAVREAQLPPVPKELQGKVYQLEVWVEFVLRDN